MHRFGWERKGELALKKLEQMNEPVAIEHKVGVCTVAIRLCAGPQGEFRVQVRIQAIRQLDRPFEFCALGK
jgi:hypothetical protein